jgi:hypothetical protein
LSLKKTGGELETPMPQYPIIAKPLAIKIPFSVVTEKFRNKYRIASARLQTWDYSSNAAYFITLCTRNRKHFFGTIANGEMQLNAIGKIVETEWINTPAIRPYMNLELDEFVVMPNHFPRY